MNLSTTSEEIKTYLENMKNMLSDPDTKFHVKEDKDKNYVFSYLYGINKVEIKEILNSLKESEFYKKVNSNNEFHRNEILYIWNPVRSFADACGEVREIELYIKTYIDSKNKLLVVISFHKFNDFS